MTERDQNSTEGSQFPVPILPWQDQQWQGIDELHQSQTLPHALLLSGDQGIGIERFAQALAYRMLCEAPRAGHACGECRQCGFNRAGMHPDLKWLMPAEPGKQIKIDDVREFVEFIAHTSQQGGYKLGVINPANAMNINAANALLKSLEEPSPNTLLLLISHAPMQLLPTIRSRCQQIRFRQPAKEQSLQWLGGLLPPAADAEQLWMAAGGRPLTALSLFESDGLERYQQMQADFLAMVGRKQTALSVAEKWQNYSLVDICEWLTRLLSDGIAHKMAGRPVAAEWQRVLQLATAADLYALLDNTQQLRSRLNYGANPNVMLALGDLLLKSCEKFHSNMAID